MATYLMDDMDAKYSFTGTVDNVKIETCEITYPDGVVINFKIIENYNYDVNTIRLLPIGFNDSRSLLAIKKYIEMYGDVVQFESFEEYKRIRFYMNSSDLYNVDFVGYVCPPEGITGFTEVNIRFLEPNHSIDIKNLGYWPSNKVTGSIFLNNILEGFTAKEISILKNKRNSVSIQHRFFEQVKDINLSKNSFLNSFVVTYKKVNIKLGAYLYYYHTFIKNNDLIYSILRGSNPLVSNNLIYKILFKIHN